MEVLLWAGKGGEGHRSSYSGWSELSSPVVEGYERAVHGKKALTLVKTTPSSRERVVPKMSCPTSQIAQRPGHLDLRTVGSTLFKANLQTSAFNPLKRLVGVSQFAYSVRRHLCVPDVIVDFLCEDETLFITVENIGEGPAHHVSVSFEPEVSGIHGETVISDLSLFQCLSFLPPGKAIRTPLDPVQEYFDREAPTQIQTVIYFESDTGATLSRSIEHDLRVYDTSTRTLHQ